MWVLASEASREFPHNPTCFPHNQHFLPHNVPENFRIICYFFPHPIRCPDCYINYFLVHMMFANNLFCLFRPCKQFFSIFFIPPPLQKNNGPSLKKIQSPILKPETAASVWDTYKTPIWDTYKTSLVRFTPQIYKPLNHCSLVECFGVQVKRHRHPRFTLAARHVCPKIRFLVLMQIAGSGGGGGGEGKVPTSERPLSLVPCVSCCKITLILCYLFFGRGRWEG